MLKGFFGMQVNIEVFCKLISFWVCATRHDQSTQHKFAHIFAISPEKERGGGGEVVFLPANKQKFSTN